MFLAANVYLEVNAMENGFERTYWANDVADLLGISTSALRKWSLRLEAAGYFFIRDEHDRRAYRESDIIALRKLKDFLDKKMGLDDAAQAVSQLYKQQPVTPSETSIVPVDSQRYEQRLSELESKIDQLVELNKQLVKQMEARDRELTQRMDAILENKRMIAASQEEKKKWYHFWRK